MTQEYLKTKFFYDKTTGDLKRISNNKTAGTIGANGYKIITIDGKKYKAHRLVFLYFFGYLPILIDHIDKNKLNNKIENLRDTTPAVNQLNTNIQQNNKSGHKGVFYRISKKKWVAQIKINYKNKHLGYFNNKEDAIKTRIQAESKYL